MGTHAAQSDQDQNVPTPTNLRLLHGNPGKRALPKNEAQLSACLLCAPRGLTPEAKRAWPQFAKPLAEVGIATPLDACALRLLVETYATWRKATEALKAEGMTCTSSTGIERPSPYFRIQASAAEQMLRLLSEFGMTPASRVRVKTGGAPVDPDAVDLFGF
ncbi:MAG: phage terminase small subunit P27 family [Polaromonas sp.]